MKKKEAKDGKKSIGSVKQFEQDLPDILKKYNIRVSKPYGCYPDDIAEVLEKLENENNLLAKENKSLAEEAEKQKKLYKEVQAEFTKFKMQVQLLRFEGNTDEQAMGMVEDGMKDIMGNSDKPKPKLKINGTKLNGGKPTPSKTSFTNLITPKKKDGE